MSCLHIFYKHLIHHFFSAKDLAKMFMKPNISNNSLSLLGDTSGWCKLLINTDKELNLQHRFSNNLYHSLDQSKLIIYII